jgi:hypothetical protein
MQGAPRKRFQSGSGGGGSSSSGGGGRGSGEGGALTPRIPSATNLADADAAACAGPGPRREPAADAPAGHGRRSSCAGAAAEAAAPPGQPHAERSIYEVWTERKRYMLLCLMSFATFLVPFSDTVYLPALSVIQRELETTQTLVGPARAPASRWQESLRASACGPSIGSCPLSWMARARRCWECVGVGLVRPLSAASLPPELRQRGRWVPLPALPRRWPPP